MRFVFVMFAVGWLPGVVLAQGPDTVFLEELTWTEVRDALAEGRTTVIIPTGGTEQNGPHMVLGKHNYVVRHKAGEVARRLGNALVAPVMAYVPEGDVDPPSGHMRFPGTITTPPGVFEQVLEFAVRSLKQHGFLDIALLGDSGGNQASQAAVAERLNSEWAGHGVPSASPDGLLSWPGRRLAGDPRRTRGGRGHACRHARHLESHVPQPGSAAARGAGARHGRRRQRCRGQPRPLDGCLR